MVSLGASWPARRGHFLLESGHHADLWLDIDALIASPRRLEPLAAALASSLRAHAVDVVCGPLIGGAFVAQAVAAVLGAEFWYTQRVTARGGGAPGTVRYVLPRGLQRLAAGRRVALVDDVVRAASSLVATLDELRTHGAESVAAGALLAVGGTGADRLAARGVVLEALGTEAFDMWPATACPLCAQAVPLEDVT